MGLPRLGGHRRRRMGRYRLSGRRRRRIGPYRRFVRGLSGRRGIFNSGHSTRG